MDVGQHKVWWLVLLLDELADRFESDVGHAASPRLGVTKSYSRPHVSNDNPYSKAQFKP